MAAQAAPGAGALPEARTAGDEGVAVSLPARLSFRTQRGRDAAAVELLEREGNAELVGRP